MSKDVVNGHLCISSAVSLWQPTEFGCSREAFSEKLSLSVARFTEMASNVPTGKSMSSNVQEIEMSGDEKWVRSRVSRFQEWRMSHSLTTTVSRTTAEKATDTPIKNARAEDIDRDQYAKGFQDGWNAALLDYKDSAAPSSCTSGPANPDRITESQSCPPTSQQVEKRGFKAGWNKV
jgi:hypothetical protein